MSSQTPGNLNSPSKKKTVTFAPKNEEYTYSPKSPQNEDKIEEITYKIEDLPKLEVKLKNADSEGILEEAFEKFQSVYKFRQNGKCYRQGIKKVISRREKRLLLELIDTKFDTTKMAAFKKTLKINLKIIRMMRSMNLRLEDFMLRIIRLVTERI